jgi:DNA-binding response OmpR family regulator
MTRGLADRRVLVVEDEYIIALNIASELVDRGAVVIGPVGIVESALDAIKNTYLDAAILDLDLRGRKVFPVADALADRHVPFIFATGCEISAGIPARHANVPRFEKPTPPAVLCGALEAAIATHLKD